jgi:hypothetical protein
MKITSDLTNLTTAILILTVQMFIEWTLCERILINVTNCAIVKTKRQTNFKDFKRFAVFKGLVEQKKRCIQLVRVSRGLFWLSWVFKTLVSLAF